MARCDVDRTRTVFLTLTFAGKPSAAGAQASFKRFTMRMRRRFPRMSCIWRKEFQERGSAHFHLICFNMPYWAQAAIQRTWEECTNEVRSIVYVKLLRNKRQAMYYVSKYIAKLSDTGETTSLDNEPYQHDCNPEGVGRQWGYLGKPYLPMARIKRAYLIDDGTVAYLSFAMRTLSRQKKNTFSGVVTLYSDEVGAMFDLAVERGGFLREPDDLLEYAKVLATGQGGDFLTAQVRASHPFVNWQQVIDRAYNDMIQQWLYSRSLTNSMSWIDRRK